MNFIVIVGSLAAFLCSISYIPQIIKGFLTKRLDDVSTLYMSVLLAGLILWITYGALRKDLVIIIANVVGASFVSMVVIMKDYYIRKRDNSKPENLLN